MKNIRFIGLALFAMVLCTSFSACGDDGEAGEDEIKPDAPNSSTYRLKSIKSTGSEYDYTINLVYDKGRLSQYTWVYDEEIQDDTEFNQSISYYKDKVVMKGEVDSDYITQTYLLNKKGQAVSCTYTDGEDDVKASFEYSPDGYLTKVVITETNRDSHQPDITYGFFNYSQEHNLTDGKEIDSYAYGSEYITNFTQLYGSELNELGIMDYFPSENTLFEYQAAFYAGILGKPCKNLVNICTEDDYKANFSYSLYQDEKYLEVNVNGSYGYWETKKYFYE